MKTFLCGLLVLLSIPSHGYAELVPIHKCDETAAHVDDNQKLGPGVFDKDVDPMVAIKTCSEAVLANPETARFHFQLGRAYWLEKKHKEAIDQFRQAAEMGHVAASSYLGEAYQNGLGGLKKDLKKAKKNYEASARGGFTPAAQMLASFRDDVGNSALSSSAKPPSPLPESQLKPVLAPAPSVWVNGLPEAIPGVDHVLLTEEVFALLVLKHYPDQITPQMWEGLIKWQVDYDRAYYKRFPDKYNNGIQWGMKWNPEPNNGYHPKYVPFSPAEFFPDIPEGAEESDLPDATHLIKSDVGAMELFKQWAVLRAASLPSSFILFGNIEKLPGDSDQLNMQFGGYSPISKQAASFPSWLVKQGHAPGQVLMSNVLAKPSSILLPNIKKRYIPRLDESQIDNWFGPRAKFRRAKIEFEVKDHRLEIVNAGEQNQAFVLHVNPTAVRMVSLEDGSLLYEERYNIEALEPNQLIATHLDTNLIGNSAKAQSLPFTAEVADLLIAKFMPGALDSENLERMLLARWFYEEAMDSQGKTPAWGSFFIEGRPKPDAEQRRGILEKFKEWTLKRAQVLRTQIVVQMGAGQKDGQIHFTSGLSPKEENTLRSQAASCARKCAVLLCKKKEIDECDAVSHASTTPSSYIFLGTGHFSSDSGPRRHCGISDNKSQDFYCQGSIKASTEVVAKSGMDFSDIIVLDRRIAIPNSRKDLLAQSYFPQLVLELEVTGIDRQTERPSDPALAGIPPVKGRSLKSTHPGSYYLFKTRIVTARAEVADHASVEMELQNVPQVNNSHSTAPTPEAIALPESEFDIIGLKLGMQMDDAEKIIRQHMTVGRVLTAERGQKISSSVGNAQPFTSGHIYISQDNKEFFALFEEPASAKGAVLGILRQINVPKGKSDAAAIIEQLKDKYGQKTVTYGETIAWGLQLPDQAGRCLTTQGSYFMNWRDASGVQGSWRPISSGSSNFIPGLEPQVGLGKVRECGTIVSVTFETETNRQFDFLTIRLIDYKSYVDHFMNGQETAASGSGKPAKSQKGLDIPF